MAPKVVEVLSRSTEAYDRGEKFTGYKSIESLREYVLISQDEVKVERHTREGDLWARSVETDLGAVIELTSVACTLPLREIYSRTDLVQAE